MPANATEHTGKGTAAFIRVMDFVGRRVEKPFEVNGKMAPFLGKVVMYLPDPEGDLWRIVYEDGDSEDMDLAELQSVLKEKELKKRKKKNASGSKLKKSRTKGGGQLELVGISTDEDEANGDRVKAYYRGTRNGYKYPGVIAKVNSKDGTYQIKFDDGDVDPAAKPEDIFLKGAGISVASASSNESTVERHERSCDRNPEYLFSSTWEKQPAHHKKAKAQSVKGKGKAKGKGKGKGKRKAGDFECEYDCEFSGSQSEVKKHEKSCLWKDDYNDSYGADASDGGGGGGAGAGAGAGAEDPTTDEDAEDSFLDSHGEEDGVRQRRKSKAKLIKKMKTKKKTKFSASSKSMEKDGAMPKKPATAYFLWAEETQPLLLLGNPGMNASVLASKLRSMWREMPEIAKIPYLSLHAARMTAYTKAMEMYREQEAAAASATDTDTGEDDPDYSDQDEQSNSSGDDGGGGPGNGEYFVDQIVDSRLKKGGIREWCVLWYPLKGQEAETSWEPRSRQVKSRTITVDGFSVLRANNYEVVGVGGYVFGEDTDAHVAPRRQYKCNDCKFAGMSVAGLVSHKRQKHGAKGQKKVKSTKKTKLSDRMALNKKLAETRAVSASRRWRFFGQYLAEVEHFVTPKVAGALKEAAEKGPLREPVKVQIQPDTVTGGEMRCYQLKGLEFLASMYDKGTSAILGDEMGLGKTLQTISFICHLKHTKKLAGPVLVVCPLSVLQSWVNEFARWAPSLNVCKLHSSNNDELKRKCHEVLTDTHGVDAIVTTYECVKSVSGSLVARIEWLAFIVDEGHVLKNVETEISKVCQKVRATFKLLLTGTPLQNNLTELWALLHFLAPKIFEESDAFDDAFNLGMHKVDDDVLRKAHDVLKLVMLRRTKDDVEKGVPPKSEITLSCPLSKLQMYWYKSLLQKDASLLDRVEAKVAGDAKAGMVTDFKALKNLFMQLRKVCNHPFVFPGSEPDPDETTTEELVKASGKMVMLDRLLIKLKTAGHRVCIFSQFTQTLDILDDYMRMRGFRYTRLDGSTNRVIRYVNIDAFNDKDSRYFAFLMSTRAGGMGINLQTADTVILFDSDWNPQVDLQAMARCHRIGQTKVVHVYRLISAGTVEERLLERATKKLYLDSMVNTGASIGDDVLEGMGAEQYLKMLKFGADKIFNSAGGRMPTDSELDAIIDRTGTKGDPSLIASKCNASTFDAVSAPMDSRMLLGKKVEQMKPTTLKDIGSAWLTMSEKSKKARAASKRRIVMVEAKGSGYGAAFVPVMKQNNYSLQHGEGSVFTSELSAVDFERAKVRKNTKRWEHQNMCQSCWDGGELICCDNCPMAYHKDCLGMKHVPTMTWRCPHHHCHGCDKNSSAAGCLFRCTVCPNAYCEDCRPASASVVGECWRLQDLGFKRPGNVAYIICSEECEDFLESQRTVDEIELLKEDALDFTPTPYEDDPPTDEDEAAAALSDGPDEEADAAMAAELSGRRPSRTCRPTTFGIDASDGGGGGGAADAPYIATAKAAPTINYNSMAVSKPTLPKPCKHCGSRTHTGFAGSCDAPEEVVEAYATSIATCNLCGVVGHKSPTCTASEDAKAAYLTYCGTGEKTCRACGVKGHTAARCQATEEQKNLFVSTANSPPCNHCGVRGHTVISCTASKEAIAKYIASFVDRKSACSQCGLKTHYKPNCQAAPVVQQHYVAMRDAMKDAMKDPFGGHCAMCGEKGHNDKACNATPEAIEAYQASVAKCNLCGVVGHKSPTCTASSAEVAAYVTSTGKKYPCKECGAPGHTPRYCQATISMKQAHQAKKKRRNSKKSRAVLNVASVPVSIAGAGAADAEEAAPVSMGGGVACSQSSSPLSGGGGARASDASEGADDVVLLDPISRVGEGSESVASARTAETEAAARLLAARCVGCPYGNLRDLNSQHKERKLTCKRCEQVTTDSVPTDKIVMYDPNNKLFPELLRQNNFTPNQRVLLERRRAAALANFKCPYGDPGRTIRTGPCRRHNRCSDCQDVRSVPGQLGSWGKWRKIKNPQTNPKPEKRFATYWFHIDKKSVQWKHPLDGAAISPVATTPTDAVLRTGKDYPSSYSPAKRLRLDADIVSSSGGMVIVPEHTCPTCDILHDTEGELNAHYDANPAHIPQLAVAKPAAGSLLDVTQGSLSLASAPCTPGTQSPGMHSSNGAAAGGSAAAGGVSPGILSNPTDVDTDNDDGVQLNPHSPVQSNDSDIQVISDNDSD
eukprot:gene649-4309_t